jgi:DNA/RNA non-specific endonuclease
MKKIQALLLLCVLFATSAKAANEDSSQYAAIIKKGAAMLTKQIAQNNHILARQSEGKINYVIDLEEGLSDGSDQPDGLTTERQINGFKGFFSPDISENTAAKNKFNTRLTALNAGKAVKVYYLLINGFNLIYNAKIDATATVSSIFNNELVDKNTAFLSYQKVHDSLATAIFKTVFEAGNPVNNTTLAIAVGHYHLVNFSKVSSYSLVKEFYFCKTFPTEDTYNGMGDPRLHITDLFRGKLNEITTGEGSRQEFGTTDSLMATNLTALEAAYGNYELKKALLTTYTVSGLKNILEKFTIGDYAALRPQERMHILSILVGENMLGNWGNNSKTNEEGLALKVLETVSKEDAENMLISLKQPSSVAYNAAYLAANAGNGSWNSNVNQLKADYSMLRRLISGIDDGPFGTRYAELIVAVKRMCMNSSKFNTRYVDAAVNFDTRAFSVGKPKSPYPGERIFNDASIANDGTVTFKSEIYFPPENTAKNPKRPLDFLNLPPGIEPIFGGEAGGGEFAPDVDFNDLGDWFNTSPAGMRLIGSPNGSYNYRSADDIVLDPFDLVMVTVNSDVASIKDGAGNSMDSAQKMFSVPAVFLYYAKDKLRNNTLGTAARVAADILVIAASMGTATPGVLTAEGALEVAEGTYMAAKAANAVYKIRRAFAIFNGLCATGDLGIIITGIENDPKYKEFVKWFQYVQILGAGGELGYGIVRTINTAGSRFIAKAKNLSPKVKEYCKKFVLAWDDFKAKVTNTAGMINNPAAWTQVMQRSNAIRAQFCLWFPELLQQIDVSIENIYSAAKLMRAKVVANGVLYSSLPITPRFAASTVYVFAYCLKVGKDATKRSLAALLQHIKKARGEINASETIPDELVDDVGRLTQNEFEGVVALQDEARLLSNDDMLAGINLCDNSIETAGKFAQFLGEKFNAVIAKCKQMGLSKGQMETLLQDFTKYKNFLAAVKADVNALNDWKKLEDVIAVVKSDFPAGWKYRKIDYDVYEVLDGSNRKLAAVYKEKVIAPGRTLAGTPGNKILNKEPLLKNITYEVDGFNYKTDDLGRVFYTDADLDNAVRVRLGNQQIRAVDVKEGVRGADQGGHIIASRFFGPGEQINLYPMSANLNLGAWKQMENLWADALVAGSDVKINIKSVFSGTIKRPDAFEVEYLIDGTKTKRTFINQ